MAAMIVRVRVIYSGGDGSVGQRRPREEEKEEETNILEEGEEEKQKVVEEGGRETTVIDAPLSPSNKARSVLWRTVRPGAPAMPAMAPRCSSGNAPHGVSSTPHIPTASININK